MSRMDTVGTTGTQIVRTKQHTMVIYRGTPVVTFTASSVELQTRGWYTTTTKSRMNQASRQFGLGFSVYQEAHQWYVVLPKRFPCQLPITIPYTEGMTFPYSPRWAVER